jgi:hypothetical protein
MVEDPPLDDLEETLLRERLGDAFREGRSNQSMQSELFVHIRIVVKKTFPEI